MPRPRDRRAGRDPDESRNSEPFGSSSRTLYCTGSTLPTRSWSWTKSSNATKLSRVVHGVNGSHDGRTSMPASRNTPTALPASAVVCPLSSRASTASSTDSNADTTKRHPASASSGQRSSCRRPRYRRTCSTLTVQSKVTSGNRSCIARTTRRECGGAFRKSGSPKVMWRAPASTSCAMSASTASSSSRRTRPSNTTGTGQCRQRCAHPCEASTAPTRRCSLPTSSRA